MATYCMSDLHGCYGLYIKMLEKINFSESDRLYILGDIVDRGSEGLKIAIDIAKRSNIVTLMGNHDITALSILSSLARGIKPEKLADMQELIDAWLFDGGRETYNEYKALSDVGRMLALMTIDSFRDYAEITVGENEFFLCHGGINNYSDNKPLSEYQTADFVFTREDYSKPKFNKRNKYLVTGHTPTAAIEGAEEGKIFKAYDHIAIDCGAVFGLGLGCICLDTMEEYYVK